MSDWKEIVSSTDEDYAGLNILLIRRHSNSGCNALVDIGTGSTGSQQILISDICITAQKQNFVNIFLPIRIPAGSKLWARGRTNESGALLYASFAGVSSDFLYPSYQICKSYGADPSTANGTTAPVVTDHVKSNYIEITPSVDLDIQHLIISAMFTPVSTSVDRSFLLDIAIGASGNEINIISDLWFYEWEAELMFPTTYSLPIKIPAGTRLSARVQQTHSNLAYTLEFVLHGLS